jgi:hypothetical protein
MWLTRAKDLGLLLMVAVLMAACGSDQKPEPLAECESAPRPIVFVHGFMGGGDNFANTVMRFESNGYCPAYLRTFDWNALSFDMEGHAAALSDFIDKVLEETGADQVDLMGHSAGGRLSHLFLSDAQRSPKVAHYVHTASFCGLEFPPTVPLLVLSSDEDTVLGSCTIDGAINQDIDGADHLQMVTLPEVFDAVYRFFNEGQAPATAEIAAQSEIALSGKILALGTNEPATDAQVEVYELDSETGERSASEPTARFSAKEDGSWGPFEAEPSTHYEFLVSGPGARPFHYYRQPFLRTDRLVYLRVLPESNPLLDLVLGELRYDDRSSTLVLFSANRALYYGRDSATLDGLDLVTPEMAPAPPDPTSTIAVFAYDVNGNGQTDGGPVAIGFPQLPFLAALGTEHDAEEDGRASSQFPFFRQYDAFLNASPRRRITLTMNGAVLNIPSWRAESEGVSIAVFDRAAPEKE